MDVLYKVRTEDYIHRKVAGTDVLVSIGSNIANFNGYIELNPAAAFLWDAMKTEITEEELIRSMADEFHLDHETASRDTEEFLQSLLEYKMVVRT